MAQYGRPSTDNSVVNWTGLSGGNLWNNIDDTTADDANYISAAVDNAYYRTALTSVTDPVRSDGHIVRYRTSRASGADTYTLDVYLQEGSTNRATWLGNGPYGVTITTEVELLSAAEAKSITNYANLFLVFVAQFVEEPPI